MSMAGERGSVLRRVPSYLSADKPFLFPHITVCEPHFTISKSFNRDNFALKVGNK